MSDYNREKYYEKNPNRKRYAIGYRCTLNDGTVKVFDSIKKTAKYVGYSEDTVKNILKGQAKNKLFELERIYY